MLKAPSNAGEPLRFMRLQGDARLRSQVVMRVARCALPNWRDRNELR